MTSTFRDEVAISEHTSECRVLTEAESPYRIVHVNDAWCKTTGYTREVLIGSTCKTLQGRETCQRTMQVSYHALEGRSVRIIGAPAPQASVPSAARLKQPL